MNPPITFYVNFLFLFSQRMSASIYNPEIIYVGMEEKQKRKQLPQTTLQGEHLEDHVGKHWNHFIRVTGRWNSDAVVKLKVFSFGLFSMRPWGIDFSE